jgi:hypothetical protein
MAQPEVARHPGILIIDPSFGWTFFSIIYENIIADFSLSEKDSIGPEEIINRYLPAERVNSGGAGPDYESVYVSHQTQFGQWRPSLGEYYDVSKLGIPERFQWLFDLLGPNRGLRLFYTWDKQDYPPPQRKKKRTKKRKTQVKKPAVVDVAFLPVKKKRSLDIFPNL